jgi:acyl-CoA thioesterase FadM
MHTDFVIYQFARNIIRSGLCNVTLNAEIEYKRNIDLFYAYKMRVNVRKYQKDNQKFEINFVNHEKNILR